MGPSRSSGTGSTSPPWVTEPVIISGLIQGFGLGSTGLSILEARLTENIQIVRSRLIEQLRPDNPLAQAPTSRPRSA